MQELQQLWGVDEEFQNLWSTLSAIQTMLEDAEERQLGFKALQDWLQKLRHIAYDADGTVDKMTMQAQQLTTEESGTESGKKKKTQQVLCIGLSCFNCCQIPHWRDMASRMAEINVRLDRIAKERRDLHFQTGDGSKQLGIITERSRRLVTCVKGESSQVLGCIDDREQIINFLLSDDSSNRKFSTVGIIGMGGIGKIPFYRSSTMRKELQRILS